MAARQVMLLCFLWRVLWCCEGIWPSRGSQVCRNIVMKPFYAWGCRYLRSLCHTDSTESLHPFSTAVQHILHQHLAAKSPIFLFFKPKLNPHFMNIRLCTSISSMSVYNFKEMKRKLRSEGVCVMSLRVKEVQEGENRDKEQQQQFVNSF